MRHSVSCIEEWRNGTESPLQYTIEVRFLGALEVCCVESVVFSRLGGLGLSYLVCCGLLGAQGLLGLSVSGNIPIILSDRLQANANRVVFENISMVRLNACCAPSVILKIESH